MEFWSSGDQKRVSHLTAEDTTVFRWCPDGQHFLTATTAPRLRVNNGWKIWNYDGQIIHSETCAELFDVVWCPSQAFAAKPVKLNIQSSATSTKAQPTSSANATASKAPAYVPPHLRGVQNKPTFKLHDEELPSNEKHTENDAASKQALKNRKKREAAKKTKGPDGACPFSNLDRVNSVQTSNASFANQQHLPTSGDLEKDKKIKNLTRKLEQIAFLKSKLDAGEKLELNQLDKIQKEPDLRVELEALKIS